MTTVGDDGAPGRVWVPTARGPFGELENWRLVPKEVAADWDVRVWNPLP